MQVPNELKDQWEKEIQEAYPIDSQVGKLIHSNILLGRINAFFQGVIYQLDRQVEYYRELVEEDYFIIPSDEDTDEDGKGRDGLPITPKSPILSKEEIDNLERMFKDK